MSFLRNRHDTWAAFLAKHSGIAVAIGLPAVMAAEDRFREILECGETRAGGETFTLAILTPAQWSAMERFSAVFFHEFESYAPLDLFPAFRREQDRRG